ncbi:VOC family protein [Bartonella sp. LJL80]
MEQRLSLITLGVNDLAKARNFYESGLGWKAANVSTENIVFFQLNGIAFSLYPWEKLAEDTTLAPALADSHIGFRGMTLAHNVASKPMVAAILERAVSAGATLVKPAQDVFWGGHSGYFADLDGHLWEVAHNPFAEIDGNGNFILP